MQRLRLSLVTALLAVAAPVAARAQIDLAWSGGFLGAPLAYEITVQGPPGLVLLAPATSPGPVPLALFDPADPRSLGVGLELLQQWRVLSVAGQATSTYALPLLPQLDGVPLYAQAVTLAFRGTLVGELSNVVSLTLGPVGSLQPTVGEQLAARRRHSATELLDGRVLLAGGHPPEQPGAPWNSLEIYDPQTQQFTASAATLPEAVSSHTANLLPDGRVLLLGGRTATGAASNQAALYDPIGDGLLPVQPMAVPRVHHTSTRLDDGRVLVVGGSLASTPSHPLGFPAAFFGAVTPDISVFDPSTATWSPVANLPQGLSWHEALLLSNGDVLIYGGVRKLGNQPQTTAAAFRLKLPNGQLQPIAPMPQALAGHHKPRELPPDPTPTGPTGGPIVIGGGTLDFQATTAVTSDSCYSFNEPSNSWAAFASTPGIGMCTDVYCTSDGTVYNGAGGIESIDLATGSSTPMSSVWSYQANSWSIAATIDPPRSGVAAAWVDGDTRLLITGALSPGPMGPIPLGAECYLTGP